MSPDPLCRSCFHGRSAALNPFCRVSLGSQQVRSHVCRNTCNPDLEAFGCLFYHSRLKDVLLQVLSQQLFSDLAIGSVSIPLAVSTGDADGRRRRTLDLTSKAGSVVGSVELQVETYDDVGKV